MKLRWTSIVCFCVLSTYVHEYEYILGQGDAQQNIPV